MTKAHLMVVRMRKVPMSIESTALATTNRFLCFKFLYSVITYCKMYKEKHCRRRYTIRQKLVFLRKVNPLLTLNPGLSLNKTSAELEVSPSFIIK